jgi:hypothetical protein
VITFNFTPEDAARVRKLLEAGRTQEFNSGKLFVPTEIAVTPEERAAAMQQFEDDLIEAMTQPIAKEAEDAPATPGEPDEH